MAKTPNEKWIGSKRYRLTVFRIKSKFPNGTPRLVERVPMEATMRLSDNPEENEFFTAFVPESVLDSDKPPTE